MKMRYQPDCSVSHDGVEYYADKDGIVEVPDEAYLALLSHGLTDYVEKKEPEKKEPEKKEPEKKEPEKK